MLKTGMLGDVCGLRDVGRADDGVLPKSSANEGDRRFFADCASASVAGESLPLIVARSVGGEMSNGCLVVLDAGPAGRFEIRDARSDLPWGSGPSSRRSRGSDGGSRGSSRSAFGPVGGCTGTSGGDSGRCFSALIEGGPASTGSGAGFCGNPGMSAVTDPNGGTCGADGGGELLAGGRKSLASGRLG